MMRKCHLNTCPVGVATQDPELRRRFTGKPEYCMNFMRFVAAETREIMAGLGFRNFDEMVGRADLLEIGDAVNHWKRRGLDFTRVLAMPKVPEGSSLRCTTKPVHDFSLSLDPELIVGSEKAIEKREPVSIFASIRNCNRSVGATLSRVSRRYGSTGLPADTINANLPDWPARALAHSWRPASPLNSKETPTITSGRAFRAASSSSTRPKAPPSGRKTISSPATSIFSGLRGGMYIFRHGRRTVRRS